MHHVAAESKIMKNDDPHTQVLSAVSVCVCVCLFLVSATFMVKLQWM